jgi:signal transduction histidine kinase
MSDALNVLLVEDSERDAKLVLQELRKLGRPIASERVEDADAMRRALLSRSWDLVISDWSMAKFSAGAAIALLRELQLDLPCVIVSGTSGEESAVEAMRTGARDYVLKDKLGRLTPAIDRELTECRERRARREAEQARQQSELRLRESEEQLRQAQKMEAIGRLAGGVAHDFNNVLSVILSYADLILAELRPADPLRGDIGEIRKAAVRAAGLTRQLLLFSRHQLADPQVVSLNTILTTMSQMLERVAGEDVDFAWRPGEELWRVRVDTSHIEHLIMNLVVNARDAMPTGGKLTIETANVVLDEEYASVHFETKSGPHVMLAVTDTGCGIPKELQASIFEPFFTTKERGKGTGLGLSSVFGIVRQSDASIWLYSEVGSGTTIKIYFPRVEGAPESIRPPAMPAISNGSETILLVEDQEQVRVIVHAILGKHGYRVLAAENAGEALLLCERHAEPIHLLLTDVVMPHMSGPELARRLLASRPDMKILCMSGYTDDSIIRHGLVEADFAYLQKPVTPASLARKVREVLDSPSRRSLRSSIEMG